MILTKFQWDTYRPRLQKLFEESFGRPITDKFFDWRYKDNLSDRFYFAVEEDEENLIASYSAFPITLIFKGCEYYSALSMTTMTHPNARGRGLFPSLANELYSLASIDSFASIIGFPNANSHNSFCSRLSWSDIYEIPTMKINVSDVAISHDEQIYTILRDDKFSYEYLNIISDQFLKVKKNREYLRWRYFYNPINSYENYVIQKDGKVLSHIVIKEFMGDMDLVDINCEDPSHLRALVLHLMAVSKSRGLLSLSCWMPTHHPMHQVLEKLNFQNGGLVTYFGGRELIPAGAPKGLLEYKSWYIQMGDSDVY